MIYRASVLCLLATLLLLQVSGELRDGFRAHAELHRHEALIAATRAAAMPASALPPPAPAHSPAYATHVGRDTVVVDISRAALARMIETSDSLAAARIVPTLRHGQPAGYKLYAIRPGSVFEALGFQNGDTIVSVNDIPITDAAAVLSLASPTAARYYDLSIRRRGEHLRIVVLVHG
jgi:general secretion pathway protein C